MLDYYLFKQVHELYEQGDMESGRQLLRDLQEKYLEQSDENTLLKTQLQEYEDILYLAKNLEFDGLSYWLITNSIRQGPFCQHCFEKDGLLIRLHEGGQRWECLSCGSEYERPQREVTTEKPANTGLRAASGKVIQMYK